MWKTRLSAKEKVEINDILFKECFFFLAVDPVVQGKTKAEQFYKYDDNGKKVLKIFISTNLYYNALNQGVS